MGDALCCVDGASAADTQDKVSLKGDGLCDALFRLLQQGVWLYAAELLVGQTGLIQCGGNPPQQAAADYAAPAVDEKDLAAAVLFYILLAAVSPSRPLPKIISVGRTKSKLVHHRKNSFPICFFPY